MANKDLYSHVLYSTILRLPRPSSPRSQAFYFLDTAMLPSQASPVSAILEEGQAYHEQSNGTDNCGVHSE